MKLRKLWVMAMANIRGNRHRNAGKREKRSGQ